MSPCYIQENMITALMVTFNDMPLLQRAIKSIYGKVDKIICVDGRYKDFPDFTGHLYSTDGTIEYLRSLNKVELRFVANIYQSDKRNEYLRDLRRGQTVLMIDADEIVEGNIPELNSDIGLVKFSELNNRYEKWLATRLFKYHEGMKYGGVHFILEVNGKLFNKRRSAENGFTSEKVSGMKIIHLAILRDKSRKYYKSQFYKTSGPREAQYKKASYE